MDLGTLIAGFVISTVGFSLFLYGKKQARPPQLVAGMIMMAAPLFVRDPIWMSAVAAAMVVGLRVVLARES